MENPFLAFFIFILILFFYIHVTAQWKTSDDLEIYESDYESASQFQEICAVKQPVVFKFQKNPVAIEFFERFQSAKFEKYDNIDIRIKDRQDYNKSSNANNSGKDLVVNLAVNLAVDYVHLSFRSARRLMTTDSNAKYFSEKNHYFLEESGLDRLSHSLDTILKPPLAVYTKYDILLGSPLVATPLRYHLESHKFVAVTRGSIRMKLCPPKYSKIIPVNRDYENYEFWSHLDSWTTSSSSMSSPTDILQKTKFLDIEVNTGDVLFIPPYWWYSISFSGDPLTTVATFTYDVAMNIAAQSKHWALFYLQQSNIKTRPAKMMVLSEDGKSEAPIVTAEVESTSDSKTTEMEETNKTVRGNKEIVTNAGTYIVG
jgi:hypothetical protein